MPTKFIDEEEGFIIVNNKMIDIWQRPLGMTAYGVWSHFKRFCSGNQGQNIFPEVSEEDWALRMGISTPTFITAIKKLEEFKLLEITKPPKEQSYLPQIYTLKKVPSTLPDEIKYKMIEIEKEGKIISTKLLIKPFPLKCRFIDPIFEESDKIFRVLSRKKNEDPSKNFLDPPLKNFKDIYNNTDNNNTEVIIINNNSKDFSNPDNSKNKKPSKIKKIHISQDSWKYELIKEWNKIPQATKHTKMDTGVAFNISRYLSYLVNGGFFNQCKTNRDYFKWNKIPISWINENRKFSKREIFNAIKIFSKDFIDGYEPKNKKIVPTSLETFLFNTNTGSSWFLKCVANPDPKPIAEERKNKDPNPQYTKFFQERNLFKYFSEKDYSSLYNGIRSIENKVINDKVFDFTQQNPKLWQIVGKGAGKLEPLFQGYAQYLNNLNEISEPEKMFYFYGYFKYYLEDLETNYSSFQVNI